MIPENKNRMLFKIPLAVSGLIGSAVILFLTIHSGVSIYPDSVTYISVARNIANGTGFVGFDGYNYVLQAPLYPLLLAEIDILTSIDPVVSVGYCNALLFGLIIYFSGLFLLKHLKSFQLVLIGTASILISLTLFQISLSALSETLFVFFIILYLYFFEEYRLKGTMSSFLLFSAAVSFACLTRYVGIVLILSASISLLAFLKNNLKDKILHLVLFLLITVTPTGLWVLRNYYLTGTLVGSRAGSSYSFSENLLISFNTVLNWFSPVQLNGQQLVYMILLISAVVVASFIVLFRNKRKIYWLQKTNSILLFMFLYSGIIVISSTTTAYDKIDNRLLSPIFVPVVFAGCFLIDIIYERFTRYFNKLTLSFLFFICLIIWMQYSLSMTKNYIEYYNKQSVQEYSGKEWRNNTVINYLNSHKMLGAQYTFFSNAPEAVYILTGLETKWSPPKTLYNSPILINMNTGTKTVWNIKTKSCLVWFSKIDRKFLFPVAELQTFTNMVKIAELADGEIYTIEKNLP